ncbi:MAG TPA: hypothetical protein PLB41_09295 [Rubrivivax sp.]|nr:hypothetical protein [Rubrivivax sp.]HPO20326.1 hypothetical protein [Rubrivivax sp.]
MKRCTPMRAAVPALLAVLTLPLPAAPPQTVYRCGPDGRSYSQAPCADGKPLSVEDPRSASQQREARDAAARDAQLAGQLADERRQREQAAKGQAAAGFRTAPASSLEAPGATASRSRRKTPAAPADPRMSPPFRAPAAAASAPR